MAFRIARGTIRERIKWVGGAAKLNNTEALVLVAIHRHRRAGATTAEIVSELYGARPDGGPHTAYHVVWNAISNARWKLARAGRSSIVKTGSRYHICCSR